jgi:molybdopterin converting factor small subunit
VTASARAGRMSVTVRLFAILRERAGTKEVTLELERGARVADALNALGPLPDGLPLVMAVNREYAAADQVLCANVCEALVHTGRFGRPSRTEIRRTEIRLIPGLLGYHRGAMRQQRSISRSSEKQASRDADVRAIARGDKSRGQLRRENEVFAPLARAARPNIRASRSLA